MKIKSVTFVRLFCVLIGISVLSACVVKQNKPAEHAHISVHIQDQDRIRFSGKGAGAGMMMSASMGAMGIAIGVAIDEGIANEIHEAFVTSGNDFSDMVKRETKAWLSKSCIENKVILERLCYSNAALVVRVKRYGFVTTSGEGDPVKADLDIGFSMADQEEQRFTLNEPDGKFTTAQLDVIKKDGESSSVLLKDGYQRLLKLYEKQVLSSLSE